MYWIKKMVTDQHDEDRCGVIRASSMLRYMQMAANEQLHELGPSNEELREQGTAFVISSLDLTFVRPIHAYQTLEAKTWACPARGFTFPRCYSLSDETGEAAYGISLCALIDIESKRIMRASDYTPNFSVEPPIDGYRPVHFAVPHTEDMTLAGTYPVTYGQTDRNQHLNNTYYPDMFANFINMDGRFIRHLNIHFMKEAPLGETLTVYTDWTDENVCCFVSVRSDGEINAEAQYTLTPLF